MTDVCSSTRITSASSMCRCPRISPRASTTSRPGQTPSTRCSRPRSTINVNPDDPNEESSNNYSARQIQILGRDKPDLRVNSVVADDAVAGGPLNVTWEVRNDGDTAEGIWYDTVYVSTSEVLGAPGSQHWVLGSVRRSAPLMNGETYSVSQTFNLAPSMEGAYVIVRTDQIAQETGRETYHRGEISETNETNNNLADAALVTRAASDLQVTTVSSTGPTFSGEQATVTWSVTNHGAAVWSGTDFWYDAIWISRDPVFSARTRHEAGRQGAQQCDAAGRRGDVRGIHGGQHATRIRWALLPVRDHGCVLPRPRSRRGRDFQRRSASRTPSRTTRTACTNTRSAPTISAAEPRRSTIARRTCRSLASRF